MIHFNTCAVILGITGFCVCAPVVQASTIHITKPPQRHSWYVDRPFPLDPPGDAADQMWVFSSLADATISDPFRPPLVVGGSGPWSASLTGVNPFGHPMPHVGIEFVLEPT